MGRSRPSYIPKETRLRGLREVSLGFNKKIGQDESRRCPQCAVATCLSGCPLGIDIPGFIRLLREGDNAQALERIRQENPFPAICGRICSAPCETACVFHADGNPIPIRALERFASDMAQVKSEKPIPRPQGKKVAVIGSGPAGMAAAYYLARANLNVTLFEAADEAGGMLRYAIPEFRLPQKILDEQFSQLKSCGVEIQTNAILGRTMMVDELFMRGFAAVLLATGASLPRYSELPGASFSGVYYDTEFLLRLQFNNKEDALEQGQKLMMLGPKVVVIGRGLAAFDAARFAARLGSAAKIVFDGFEEEALVYEDILLEAREEGIELLSLKALEIVGDEAGFARGVKCREHEEEPIEIEAQTIILANAHRPNDFLKQVLPQLRWDEDGSLWADAATGMTSVDKIFACGDVVTAAGKVVDAIAGGKAAAFKMIQYLG